MNYQHAEVFHRNKLNRFIPCLIAFANGIAKA